jgi:Zn-dependent protease with chaperone function
MTSSGAPASVLHDPIVRPVLQLALRIGAVTLMVALTLGVLVWWVLALATVAGVVAWLARALSPVWRPVARSDLTLRISRREHPELFAALDGVCAQMALPTHDVIDVIPEANAYASTEAGRDVIALGMPLITMKFRWELLTTFAHELGHLHGGDTRAVSGRVLGALAAVSDRSPSPLMKKLVGPILAEVFPLFTAIRQREERRADAWSAYVIGRGAVAGSLRTGGQIAEIWSILMHQAARLAEAGERVDNVFAFARAAWERAEREQLLGYVQQQLDAEHTDPLSTHPALRERVAHAEKQVEHLTHAPPALDETARQLLHDPESVERAWTAALFTHLASKPAASLRALADRHVVARSNALHIADGRALLAKCAQQVALEDLPMSARAQIVFESTVSKKHRDAVWLVPCRVGTVERTVEVKRFKLSVDDAYLILRALLTEAVLAGVFEGSEAFGLPGTIKLGEHTRLTRDVAAELCGGHPTWLVVMEALRRWDRLEKTDPRAKVLLPDWRAREAEKGARS